MKTFNLDWVLYQGGQIWDICTPWKNVAKVANNQDLHQDFAQIALLRRETWSGDFKARVAQNYGRRGKKLSQVSWMDKYLKTKSVSFSNHETLFL